jgi:hypothetical protein
MAKYLISFPSAAMVVPDGELAAVGREAHAVIEAAAARPSTRTLLLPIFPYGFLYGLVLPCVHGSNSL